MTAQADTRAAPAARTPAAAWRMLVLGIAAQAAGSLLVSTPVYLIPLLHVQRGIPLAQAGALASAPTIGMVLTLVAWGALADRYGERWVIAGGLALTAAFALAAVTVHGFLPLALLLGLGGASAASTSAASGRVVVGWFPRWRRGLAMGLRQMSQPLGVAAAALVVPPLASRYGVGGPLLVAGLVLTVLALACALGIRNPPRPPAAAADSPHRPSPYRQSSFLARIHLVSAFLVLPQFTLSTFGLLWLVVGLGWNQTAAGLVIGAAQIIGALGRILVGTLSDRVGGRVRVLRWVAVSGVAVMSLLALTGFLHWAAAGAVMLVIATTVSVADNGLAFTSVAEAAGPAWSGKALGIQNTGQFLAASAVGPGVGALIGAVGYPLAFALVALAPLVSIPLVPAHDAIAPADLSRGWNRDPGVQSHVTSDTVAPSMRATTVLWDIDGTLVRSGGVAARAFLDAVAEVTGVRPTPERRDYGGRVRQRNVYWNAFSCGYNRVLTPSEHVLHDVARAHPAALRRCHDLAYSRAKQRVTVAQARKRGPRHATAQQRPQRREHGEETIPDQHIAFPGNRYRRLGDGQIGRLGKAIRDGGDSYFPGCAGSFAHSGSLM